MFSVTDLSGSCGHRRLFDKLQFSLNPGEWLRVRGAHGSGKTILLRTLVGLRPAEEGSITWNGQTVDDASQAYREAFIYLGHQPALKEGLTPLANLQQSLRFDDVAVPDATIRAALQNMGLAAESDLPVRALSFGQRKLVALSRLALRPARLWVLDDPCSALSPAAIARVNAMLQAHLAEGGMLILAGHDEMVLPDGKELQL